MQFRPVCLIVLLCYAIVPVPVAAKDGIEATIYTPIPASASAGTQIKISWTLINKKSGLPFNASCVFVRLTGSTGDSTESFAADSVHSDGYYEAVATVPAAGISRIEIGVAGKMKDQQGHIKRSDWLFRLANDPIKK